MFGISGKIFLLFVVAHCSHAQPCKIEGEKSTVHSTVYQCLNGTMVSVGCSTSSGQFLEDGNTTKTDSYLYQCQKTDDGGRVQLVAIGCFKNGRMLGPSQTYVENSIWYTCQINAQSYNVFLETSGCVGPEGEKVATDKTLTKGVYVFKCILNGSEPNLVPFGCFYKEKPYGFSDAVHVGQFWYSCEKVGSDGIQLQLKGCLDENTPLQPGEIFHSHGFIFKCEKMDTGLRRSGVGCLEVTPQKNILEHQFGDKWVEGNIKMKYVVQCSQDEKGVAKTPIQCYFQSADNTDAEGIPVTAGCMLRKGNFLYQCKKTDKGGLRSLTTENSSAEDEAAAILAGYKFC